MNGGKYDYAYDEIITNQNNGQEETSHTKILKMVKPETAVLECGPANGVMTRYLKQKLGCTVTIIELDRNCYEQAMQFGSYSLRGRS